MRRRSSGQIGLEFINEFLSQADNYERFSAGDQSGQTRARLALAIGLFDRNHDGKLDAEERKSADGFSARADCNSRTNGQALEPADRPSAGRSFHRCFAGWSAA